MPVVGDAAVPLMRRGLRWLAALTLLGIVVELAVERHWTQPTQLIAWAAVAAAALALGLVQWRPSAGRVRLARILAILVIVSSAVGVWQHVAANYDAGSLDFRYGATWDTLPELTRWWLALTKTVGPAPLLAPGALAQAGLCILLSAIGQPALALVAGAIHLGRYFTMAGGPPPGG
jgi:hypothetical protein